MHCKLLRLQRRVSVMLFSGLIRDGHHLDCQALLKTTFAMSVILSFTAGSGSVAVLKGPWSSGVHQMLRTCQEAQRKQLLQQKVTEPELQRFEARRQKLVKVLLRLLVGGRNPASLRLMSRLGTCLAPPFFYLAQALAR